MRPLDEKGSKNERLIRNDKDLESVWVWITLKQKHPRRVDFSESEAVFLGFLFKVSPCFHVVSFPRFTTDQASKQGRQQSIKEGRKKAGM